jgi:hypothetical protein
MTEWTRVEGTTVSADLEPGLQARLGDPLWLLARQWQVGEFSGEDAASPVQVRAKVTWHPLGEVRVAGGDPEPLDPDREPLESRVECEQVWAGPARFRLAAEAGLQLLRLAEAAGADAGLADRLRLAYPLRLPPDDRADPRGRLELELLATRSFDAAALAAALRAGEALDPAVAPVADRWLAGIDGFAVLPPDGRVGGWDPERMEYGFEVAAPRFTGDGTRLLAAGYPGGHLDWHAYDLPADAAPTLAAGAVERGIEMVPVPLAYAGMPAPRWWAFEDGAVYWGDIQGGPQDLARYLVAAFATLAGDDWSLMPVDLPRGVLAQVAAVEVVDSFGHVHPIHSTAAQDFAREDAARAWRFFELTGDPAPAAGQAPRLLLPAALPPHENGTPVEEVLFLRDQGANLAWAVERVVESIAGRRVFRAATAPTAEPGPPPAPGTWGYTLSTPVPPHFVPLVPVRTDDPAAPAMRLQRGRLATADGSTGAFGLVLEPDRRLLLHEEEIPASGLRVTRGFQLCRSPDGGLHLWAGRRKRPGRDPVAPALRHDVVTITETGTP